MSTASKPIPPLPREGVPFIDVKTGQVAEPWYRWLAAIDAALRQIRTEIP